MPRYTKIYLGQGTINALLGILEWYGNYEDDLSYGIPRGFDHEDIAGDLMEALKNGSFEITITTSDLRSLEKIVGLWNASEPFADLRDPSFKHVLVEEQYRQHKLGQALATREHRKGRGSRLRHAGAGEG